MFSRKRHFYEKKTFYGAVFSAFLLVVSLSLWMGGTPGTEISSPKQQDHAETPSVVEPDTQVSSLQVDQNIGQAGITGGGAVEKPAFTGYVVLEEDHLIKVYVCEPDGSKKLVRTTDISFDLLGEEDQALFRAGIQLENNDQLMELLQDFES